MFKGRKECVILIWMIIKWLECKEFGADRYQVVKIKLREKKMINTILFDLDGTLLPMDQELFVKTYFKLLLERLVPLGYEKEKLIQTMMAGVEAMVRNDGSTNNETVF